MKQATIRKPVDAPIHQRRAHKRFDYETGCMIKRDGHLIAAQVKNISEGGINLVLLQEGPLPVGKIATLTVDTFAPIDAVVRWNEGTRYGVQFLSSIEVNEGLCALIRRLESGHVS